MKEWHTIQVLKRQGVKKKAIARELGISKNTVKRYWKRQSPPIYQRSPAEKLLDPYAFQVNKMVGQQFIGTRIFHELTSMGYSGSLTTVYRYLRQFKDEADNKATIRFESLPGKQMQYDWKEWSMPVAGRPLKIYFHQVILSYSRYKFVTFSLDVTTPSIIRILQQALIFFQGVPEEVIIDNPKQLVLSHDRQGVIRYQDDFLAFLGIYGLKPDPCQPYRARTKGKVENPFFYLQEHFLRGLEVEHLEDLEEQLARFMEQYNARPHSTTGVPPVELWPQENLRPLQTDIPLSFQKESRKTSWDGYVHVDSNRYPVPLAMAGKKVWIERVLGRWLNILDADLKLLTRYELLRGRRVSLPHPEHADLSREFLDRKEQRRLQVKVVFQETFPTQAPDFIPLAEQSYTLNASYHLNKILDLLTIYDHQAVATALQTALELGTPSIRSVQALLPEKLQQPVMPTSCRTAGFPAVAKRPLALYRASYGGGSL